MSLNKPGSAGVTSPTRVSVSHEKERADLAARACVEKALEVLAIGNRREWRVLER